MARIRGTSNSETLTGTEDDDVIFGGPGNDVLIGLGGNDHLFGGRGNDGLRGDSGNDHLDGGKGNDFIVGGSGNDRADGGAGNDRIYGEGGNDLLLGGLGNDMLDGAYGSDRLFGGDGRDLLKGGGGDDYLDGGSGNDTLIGGSGVDSFDGESGDDTLIVSALPLTADGGSGIDTMNLDALGKAIDLSGSNSSRFVNIEKIDLGGANANTLLLDVQSVIDMTGTNGADTLLVKGDVGDAISLEGNWTKGATITNPLGETGSFISYTNGQAKVLVESNLSVVTGALAAIDLATLDGTNGFTLIGIDQSDFSGGSVSFAGDVNGDGFADLIVGASTAESAGGASVEGESYVVFGKASWAGTPALDLATLDGTNGFRLIGIDVADFSGFSVSSAGDVNGDGFADLNVGAPFAESAGGPDKEGESYVVFGKASWAGVASLDLATLDGTNGFRLSGIDVNNLSGWSVSSAGDVNGDGLDDLIVGAPNARQSYVVFGKASWAGTPSLDLATLDGTNGFRLNGIDAGDRSGHAVSSAGDVNGDGFADLIVGAYYAESAGGADKEGESYVVFGKASWAGTPSLDLATLDGTNGFRLIGIDEYDGSGRSVSSAGDVNGDGFADLIVGAPYAESAGETNDEGESYVVFGKASWAGTPSLDLATLDGTNGFRLNGIDAFDYSGLSVSSAGDVNGDGFADLIVGAPRATSAGGGADEGESYVVYGKASWAGTPSLDLATLDGINGFRLSGIDAFDQSGFSVSSAGDVNGDGFADLIVGAPNATSAGGAALEGESYVVFGGNFNGAVTHLGGAGDDMLTGTAAAETFVGGAGNDTMRGKGGADSFQGGSGDDTIIVGSGLPLYVSGGSGIDTVNLAALAASIDLSGLDSSRFVEIEKIDLGGSGANTLKLDAQSVFNMTGANGDTFADNTLLVKGDVGDSVRLDGTWTKDATLTDPFGETGEYVRYTNGQAKVLVESDLTVLTGALAAIDLATLDGTNGFRLIGIDENDESGLSVSSAGDVNGDGFDDVIVGASAAESAGGVFNNEGESYVVFGKASWAGTPALDLATLDGTNGFTLIGIDQGDFSGKSVSSAGDVNGDGFADLIVGAYLAESAGGVFGNEGESYVVFGKASWTGVPSLDLATLDGTSGFRLTDVGFSNDSGYSVSSAGDVNGDGFADLIVGAPGAVNTGYGAAGESYVVFGKASWAGTPSLDLATLDGTNGFRLIGIDEEDQSGSSVSSAGDVNGDGFADLVVGAFRAESAGGGYDGESYVVFGKASWAGTPSLDLAALDGTNGFRLISADALDYSGRSVSSAGDVNGDGFADLIVGSPGAESDVAAESEGESYVVFGKASWAGVPSLDLATLDGTNGFRLSGIDADDRSGISVDSAGDVNGDGFADVIVGAYAADSAGGANGEGESYVVYGKASWAGVPSLDLAALDGTNGFRLSGIDAGDASGRSVSSAGDVNGDGFADLIVGADIAESAGGATNEGESYVVFGGNFNGAVTHLSGTGDDTQTGSAAAETFVGGAGNDTTRGNGGADSFQGGAGNDTMRVSTLDFFLADGGTGSDTLELNGAGLDLDLTALADNRTRSIERIDLTGSGDNSLTLSVLDVLNLSEESNELLVLGNAGDTVSQGASWTAAAAGGTNGNGTSTIDGQTYQIYSAGQAALLVDTDMSVGV
jgi:hypothetical protein